MASTHHGVVYTKKWVVDLILDVAGYVPGTGISDKVIIEPSCGCGAFIQENPHIDIGLFASLMARYKR